MGVIERFKLEGKTALVTGGGRGIGKAFCLALAQAGADVAVADLDEASAKGTAEEIRVLGRRSLALKVDVTRPEEVHSMVEKTVKQLGHLDIAVNNAGGVRSSRWAENIKVEDFDFTLRLDLLSVFNSAQEEAYVMIPRRRGKVINTASISGSTVNSGAAYSAAKAGVIMLTKVLAAEWGRYGINVNCISPGRTVTPGASWVSFPEEVKRKWEERIPLQRLGKVEDLLGALVFLASEASDYVTGLDLTVDGGSTLGTFEPEALPHFKDKPKWLSFIQPSGKSGTT